MSPPTTLVIMGVSGSGKTTVGQALATRLGWPFKEGDDLHPSANIAKMKAGLALNDADRAPWLAAIVGWIDDRAQSGEPGVISCSALRRAYRERLTRGRPAVVLVYLRIAPAVAARRAAHRQGHFMPASLIDSQFADLEEPGQDERILIVEADSPVASLVQRIIDELRLSIGEHR